VLGADGKERCILMCSNLGLSAQDIITIYCCRSKREGIFLFFKHILGGFCYRFWTKALPELKRKEKIGCLTTQQPRDPENTSHRASQ